MPLPKPRAEESENEFISRCVGELTGEYPDEDQRLAVCYGQWERGDKEMPALKVHKTATSEPEHKFLSFEQKELTDQGTFEGLLSAYDVVDSVNDVVERGAYRKTLQENGGRVPLLWYHDPKQPIGILEVEDRDEGLWVKGNLILDVPKAKEAYALMRENVVRGLSIGYQAIKADVKKGIRYLKEIRLFEGSVVLFPALASARILTVKDSEDADSVKVLVEAAEEALQQFNIAYSELAPKLEAARAELEQIVSGKEADSTSDGAEDTSKEAVDTQEEAATTSEPETDAALEALRALRDLISV